jgi:hypothetical protein
MTAHEWFRVDERDCSDPAMHVWKYTPDPDDSFMVYPLDSSGRCWALRRCLLCGDQERRLVAEVMPA